MTLTEVIDKYFKGETVRYFSGSDAHSSIEGDPYIRYSRNGGIELWIGGDNGEVCVMVTANPEKLERLLVALLY